MKFKYVAGFAFLLAVGVAHAEHQEGIFVTPAQSHGELLLLDPPSSDSEVTKAELAMLHHIEDTRTEEEVGQAKSDSHNESMFLYATLFGDKFNARKLPLTAILSQEIANDEGANVDVLKPYWHRPRPYLLDTTLKPACSGHSRSGSYPSGHTTVGFLEGLALIEMVPEKRDLILQRAENFAHNRLICGVHYPSDLAAGERFAYAIHALMTVNPRFQHDLAAATREVRAALDLPALKPAGVAAAVDTADK
ncbi:MAG: phosphatase PAP2 family protein [Hyphomicrobiales bacterium]|nr:phosphatase PAP2 family protein [Hyphomicrobiales bacterium]MDE2114574.1 phosphatase PAP2 family protein [Hyphomicrobiales bacterium]